MLSFLKNPITKAGRTLHLHSQAREESFCLHTMKFVFDFSMSMCTRVFVLVSIDNYWRTYLSRFSSLNPKIEKQPS
jgi:hypothetical protein